MNKFSMIFSRVLCALLLSLVLVFVGCTEEPAPIAVTSVTLDSTSMTLVEDESQQLTATISPSNAQNKEVIWISSNPTIASVKDGFVRAINSGKAIITVKSKDGDKTATCEVTVNEKIYPVESVSLDKTSYEMTEGDEFTLFATIEPSNATNKNVTWSCSNTSVATVYSNGVIIAKKAGKAIITVTTIDGNKTATCTVIVSPEDGRIYYVDNYLVNHGKGVMIGETIWAPVNCGYHKTKFKYGKLYQWGRRFGQGYNGSLYDYNGKHVGEVADSQVPTMKDGPVSLSTGQSQYDENYFYLTRSFPHDWLTPQNDSLWNSGTESSPVKTPYDPCPEGWRVPTYAELKQLIKNYSSWASSSDDQPGLHFSGAAAYSSSVACIFLPAAGNRISTGNAFDRGSYGYYWCSCHNSTEAFYIYFGRNHIKKGDEQRKYGMSVRCVQE